MSDNTPPQQDERQPENDDRRRRFALGALVIIILVALGVGAALVLRSSDDSDDANTGVQESSTTTTLDSSTTTDPTDTTIDDTTTTIAQTTTSTTASVTTIPTTTTSSTAPTATTVPLSEPTPAIWPRPGADERFDDPIAAAESFLRDFVGFDQPLLGDFAAGDSRSGEIEARPNESGPVTVIFLRQVDSDDWSVIGTASENISVTQPAALAEVESPLIISGSALAFEGTVSVLLYADAHEEPILESFVTGSGGPQPGPFEGTLVWEPPASRGGMLVFISESSEDGSAVEVVAMRIIFASTSV